MVTRNSQGFVEIPLIFSLVILSSGLWGTWGLLRRWRHLAEEQLRLDRCVGEVTQNFRDSLKEISRGNQRLTVLRVSIASLITNPELAAPVRAAMELIVGEQELIQLRWRAKTMQWQLHAACGNLTDQPVPLPEMKWIRLPPDPLGPQPLKWEGLMPEEFFIQLGNPPRYAAAHIIRSEGDTDVPQKIEWTPPRSPLLRPDFR